MGNADNSSRRLGYILFTRCKEQCRQIFMKTWLHITHFSIYGYSKGKNNHKTTTKTTKRQQTGWSSTDWDKPIKDSRLFFKFSHWLSLFLVLLFLLLSFSPRYNRHGWLGRRKERKKEEKKEKKKKKKRSSCWFVVVFYFFCCCFVVVGGGGGLEWLVLVDISRAAMLLRACKCQMKPSASSFKGKGGCHTWITNNGIKSTPRRDLQFKSTRSRTNVTSII